MESIGFGETVLPIHLRFSVHICGETPDRKFLTRTCYHYSEADGKLDLYRIHAGKLVWFASFSNVIFVEEIDEIDENIKKPVDEHSTYR